MNALDTTESARLHVLTVALEDYFQVGAFNRNVQCGRWHRFECRLERNTDVVLALLERRGIKATFFVLGWIAEHYPELVRRVADAGHEIASKGYHHRSIRQMSPEEFREDVLRSVAALEKAGGRKVLGYRVAHEWFNPIDLWALDVLADCGLAYDSSIASIGWRYAHEPWRRFQHRIESNGKSLWELPISSCSINGFSVPIAGGNYFRQLPPWFVRAAVDRWHRRRPEPMVMYFHAWEIDPEQPKLNSGSAITSLRHYRNLAKMESRLEYFFERYRFTSARDYLKLDDSLAPAARTPATVEEEPIILTLPPPAAAAPAASTPRMPVSIVVPCFNEELVLPYLANTLRNVEERLAARYDVRFVLVDDGSSDATWPDLQRIFGSRPNYRLVRHGRNFGVAAAILTGINSSDTEIVASIDCDCTYDPGELERMLPLMTPEVDLVTASPYHPQGGVRNVPEWRLVLSRGASWLYRRVLHHKLATYTSCFRIYRKSPLAHIAVRESGFLGVAEVLGRLDLAGFTIVEYPAVLEARLLGRSKMKTLRTIFGHLRLLARLAAVRWGSPRPARATLATLNTETLDAPAHPAVEPPRQRTGDSIG